MNHIFGEHIGSFLDVYLDDIIIYSDSLSEKKLQFLCKEVKILGRVVTDDGIKMDPEKVDRILNWKVPTNRTLCKGIGGTRRSKCRNTTIPLDLIPVCHWTTALVGIRSG